MTYVRFRHNDHTEKILLENEHRRSIFFANFNPITGEGSVGKRVKLSIPDFPIQIQYLPEEMMDEPFVKALQKAGSVERLIKDVLDTTIPSSRSPRSRLMLRRCIQGQSSP